MRRNTVALVTLSVILGVLLSGAWAAAARAKLGGSLEVLCAPALRSPVEEMLVQYEKQTGVQVQMSYDGSNLLLGQLRLRPHGDLFIPADRFYTDEAVRERLAENPRVFAYLVPVIMVQKGNPRHVRSLADLARSGLRVGLVDDRTGAIGKVSAQLLEKNKIDLAKINVVYRSTKVDELGNAIKLRSVDAVIVWRPVAVLYNREGDIVTIPNQRNVVVPVSAAVIRTSSNKAAARQFLAFLASKSGKAILAKHHYPTTDPSPLPSPGGRGKISNPTRKARH